MTKVNKVSVSLLAIVVAGLWRPAEAQISTQDPPGVRTLPVAEAQTTPDIVVTGP